MLRTIYRWERTSYVRDSVSDDWMPDKDEENEVLYPTEQWMQNKTGPSELRFWEAIDADVKVEHMPDGTVIFDNICVDRLQRRYETFEPIELDEAIHFMSQREMAILDKAESMRNIPYMVETVDGAEHVILCINPDDEPKGLCIDLDEMRPIAWRNPR